MKMLSCLHYLDGKKASFLISMGYLSSPYLIATS
jgi:hypothetical protein